jgi:hypothetical protein
LTAIGLLLISAMLAAKFKHGKMYGR